MAKKYLSLSEAAELLSVTEEELKGFREAGDIRGFADRGNWKFRSDDVSELKRTREATSDPEVTILGDDAPVVADTAADFNMGRDAGMGTEPLIDAGSVGNVLDEDDFGEEPTLIRKKGEDFSRSDSDVMLVLDESTTKSGSDPSLGMKADSDSDVSLVPGTDSDVRLADAMGDSDSDVQLVDGGSSVLIPASDLSGDSDSDVRLSNEEMDITGGSLADSDSDVKVLTDSSSDVIVPDSAAEIELDSRENFSSSDSDVRLVGLDDDEAESPSKGAVAAAGAAAAGLAMGAAASGSDTEDDSEISLDFGDDGDDDSASVLLAADDSGITLGSDSGIALESVSDSGISLDMSDEEGISLAEDSAIEDDSAVLLADDSGIALEAIGDSGISLDDDSGIALESGSDVAAGLDGTDSEFDLLSSDEDVPATQFEMETGDSEFDLDAGDETAEFAVSDLADSGDMEMASLDDSVEGDFDLGDDDFEDGTFDSLDAASVADIDLIEGDDAFEDDFDAEDGEVGYAALPVARGRAEQEWSGLTVAMVGVSALVSALAVVMMFDLMANIYSWEASEPVTGVLIDTIAGGN